MEDSVSPISQFPLSYQSFLRVAQSWPCPAQIDLYYRSLREGLALDRECNDYSQTQLLQLWDTSTALSIVVTE